jgi:predicted ATPase
MQVELTLRNYRCFPDSRPVRFSVADGLTAFIGVNNSGKSSLLKFFYEFRNLFSQLSSPGGSFIDVLRGGDRSFNYPPSITDMNEVFSEGNDRRLQIDLQFTPSEKELKKRINVPFRLQIDVSRGKNSWSARIHVSGEEQKDKKALSLDGSMLKVANTPLAECSILFNTCSDLGSTLYIGPFRNAINVGTKTDYFDIQVGQAFIERWRTVLEGQTKKESKAAYKLTEDIKHIFEFDDLQINPSADNQTLQVFINGSPFKLSEVGSGLTQFVLVLANASLRQPAYILLDEPELNLHPSLQVDFLTTVASYSSRGLFFSTHSIGLARACGDRVYSVRKIVHGQSEVAEYTDTPRLSEFLGELSFAGYKDAGFDKVLLVEGRTDVKTIQQILAKYKKDHRVVLLPLGGESMISKYSKEELQEIKRTTEHVFSVIDSERTAAGVPLSPGRQVFVSNCEDLGITCHVLERRATENYLSDSAIKKVIGPSHRALSAYETLGKDVPSWGKSENWRIAKEMTEAEFDATDLGKFLKSI